ncbi:hypothetical protein LTR99_004765 [Exophiala xenobiotica]|uniref:DhaK domain-containing protein n=1 Tax=Vermiconidia calcicola TaxID=1690605 RepID=A0AAV9QC77_9PEZI|nr:hypothetical protein LTR99_004765 [Exophiala xenobiotica]KAK5433002.1 hypothetical protein LTR34_004475 [Exophiala xenobiotica]KAK5540046.1 hypothetical protein LTR25_003751 [Vermiconidia calcicola]KAK5543136.1 dihydroxyacetone kinase Dak1 [Chaetothyriales sp. CCFEE 6169]
MENSISKLPASYGIEVDDIITFDLLADRAGEPVEDSDNKLSLSSEQGAGVLLVAKICDALATAGYSDQDIRKVGGLVSRNLMTCESSQISDGDDDDGRSHAGADTGADRNDNDAETKNTQKEVVEVMLRGLLDEKISRSHSVRMNSNEPVVLINFNFSAAHIGQKPQLLRNTADETVKQLQEDWNIWPVRVYAGPFLPTSTSTSDGFFSITLLNVVNTDIGGPSMVQLLDTEASNAPEWCRYMRKEAWRGRDFLYREERDAVPDPDSDAVSPDDASEHSVESDDNGSVASEPSGTILQEAPSLQGDAAENDGAVATAAATTDLASRDVSSEAQKDPSDDEPEAKAKAEGIPLPKELKLPERHVEHPTWDRRDDSTSLMDLIRPQASMLTPFGQNKSDPAPKKFPEEEAHGAGEESNSAEKSSSDGGDYVVV